MDTLNNFYYDLLNINKNNNVILTIEGVINKLKIYMKQHNIQSTQMCKVLSNTIYNDLKNVGIASHILNTYDLFKCYEHEFIIVHYKEKSSLKFILIDLSYEQFVKKENITLLNNFIEFPSEYLKDSHVLYDLLQNGYSKIDELDFQKYLYSIHQNKNDINAFKLEDVVYKRNLKK